MRFNLFSLILSIAVIITHASLTNSTTQAEQLNSAQQAKTTETQFNLSTVDLINGL